ncbi:UNVERIFIED_CONTAM: hypothetical protein GTU68_064305 [Idotea baltica]|nr:hypothetical protein [Idotea baltica]
MDYFIAKLYR